MLTGFIGILMYGQTLLSGRQPNHGSYNETGASIASDIAYDGMARIDSGYRCEGTAHGRSGTLYYNSITCDRGAGFLIMQTVKPYRWYRVRRYKFY